MIKFTTVEGSALLNATDTNPVLVKSIVLLNDNTVKATITDFVGAVVKDDNNGSGATGIGNYLILDFKDESSSEYTIDKIEICDVNNNPLAVSEDVSVLKNSGKQLKLRVTAQFEDAIKCTFENISVNIPYATKNRDGIIRFANYAPQAENNPAQNKDNLVYSAADVEQLVNDAVTVGVSGANQYVPWDKNVSDGSIREGFATISDLTTEHVVFTNEKYPNNTADVYYDAGENKLLIYNTTIAGDAVASEPAWQQSEDDTSGKQYLVTDGKLITDDYLSMMIASSTNDEVEKLTTIETVNSIISETIGEDYDPEDIVHKSGDETLTGAKTFSAGITSSSFAGDGVYSSYSEDDWATEERTCGDEILDAGTNNKLPTVKAVDDAINAKLNSKSNDLQSQIDALNAGQNLADIVDDDTALQRSIDITNLRAKNDFVSDEDAGLDDSDRAKWGIGDKVQVLHDRIDHDAIDEEIANGDTDTDLGDRINSIKRLEEGVATVYELVRMTDDESGDFVSSHPHDIQYAGATEDGAQYYWRYIGVYGCASYTKSEANDLFFLKDNIASSVNDDFNTDETVPSSAAVNQAFEELREELGENYVTVDTEQSITGEKSFAAPMKIYAVESVDDNDGPTTFMQFTAGGDGLKSGVSEQISFTDAQQMNAANLHFISQTAEASGGMRTNLSSTRRNVESSTATVKLVESLGTHYDVDTSDVYLTTAPDPKPGSGRDTPLVGAWRDAGIAYCDLFPNSSQYVDSEDYAERIRLRRTEVVDGSPADTDDFKWNGTHTFIDLYADHITTLGKDIHFQIFNDNNSPEDILTIKHQPDGYPVHDVTPVGVYSTEFCGGYKVPIIGMSTDGTHQVINGYEHYSFGPAGSKDVVDVITADNASDTDSVPTTKAVAEAIENSKEDTLTGISASNEIGSMGLFAYTADGAELGYGAEINGAYLKCVGMSLPLSGQISYKISTPVIPFTGKWKLLSLAVKRSNTEPCIVLAQKVREDDPTGANG